jgi:hypothetical protein
VSERRNQSAEQALRRAETAYEARREYDALETVEDRIYWLASHGAEAPDIVTRLDLRDRLDADAKFREEFDRLYKLGVADMRIEVAQVILAEAKGGVATAVTSMAKAHLAAFKDDAPDTSFAGDYRKKVDELISLIRDDRHQHVRDNLEALTTDDRQS